MLNTGCVHVLGAMVCSGGKPRLGRRHGALAGRLPHGEPQGQVVHAGPLLHADVGTAAGQEAAGG